MTKSVVQTLLELWQAWCRDHLPGEPVPVTNHPLSEEPFPNVQSEFPLTQLRSYRWSLERGDQHLPFRCPPWGSCRLQWGHTSVFSAPSWTNQVTSAILWKSCPRGLSPSWSPFSGHALIVWCPLYIEVPKPAHSSWGGAAPVQSGTTTSPDQPAMLCLMHPRKRLALLAAGACYWHVLNLPSTQTNRHKDLPSAQTNQ